MKNKIPPQKTYISASSQQLSEIFSLNQQIKKSVRQVNGLYSMTATILLLPPLIILLFLDDEAPFGKAYRQIHEMYYQNFLSHLFETETKFAMELFDRAKEISNGFFIPIRQIAQYNDFIETYGKLSESENIDSIINVLDEFLKNKPRLLTYLKNYLIFIHNKLQTILNVKFTLPDNLESYSIKDLYDIIRKDFLTFDINKHDLKNRIDEIHASKAEKLALIEINRWVVIPKIILMITAQYFIISPFFDRFFPNGFMQPKLPVVKHVLNSEDASNLIKELKTHQSRLEKKAKAIVLVARFFSLILLPITLYTISITELSSSLVFVCIVLLSTATTNLQKEFKEVYDRYTFMSKLSKLEDLWEEVLKDLESNTVTLESVINNSLQSSYFKIQFDRRKNISPKKLARLFVNCCLQHQIKVTAHTNNIITLPALSGINGKKASAIQKMFQASIARYESIQILIKQIKKINKFFEEDEENILIKPKHDSEQLPIVEIHFSVSRKYQNKLEEFKNLFFENEVQIQEKNDPILISLTRDSVIEKNSLKTFLAKSTKKYPLTFSSFEEDNSASDKVKRLKKSKEEEVEKKEKTITQETSPRRIIFWKAGTYDSNDTENDIYPIPISRVKDKRTYLKTNLFVKNNLKEENIPENIYKEIEKRVKDPELVSSKGAQGFVFWRSMELDQNGNWFRAIAKLKLLGVNGKGKVRAFIEEEKANTGETLWVIKGINYRHK